MKTSRSRTTQTTLVGLLIGGICTFVLVLGFSPAVGEESPFKPVPASEIDPTQTANAEEIGLMLLSRWNEGKYERLGERFTPEMQEALTPEAQREAHGSIKALMGDFQSMNFAEAAASPAFPNLVVYRFRGTFTNSTDKPEVRVVMNKMGRCAGFWVKAWQDEVL